MESRLGLFALPKLYSLPVWLPPLYEGVLPKCPTFSKFAPGELRLYSDPMALIHGGRSPARKAVVLLLGGHQGRTLAKRLESLMSSSFVGEGDLRVSSRPRLYSVR
jgi:hypothetical protein